MPEPTLLCRTCGQLATHVHFIPWIEEPERVRLACERCDPGDEWFTLLELAASPEKFSEIAARSNDPPPKALMDWLAYQGAPAEEAETAPPVRAPESEPTRERPLSIKQAVPEANVSESTLRRRLPRLEEAGMAWKVGSRWQIDPGGLHHLRDGPEKPARKRRSQRSRGGIESTRWEA